MLQELYVEAEGDKRQTKAVKEFGSYIRNNWEEIVRRKRLDIPGSCTEGQISHVLSERFSRDPMGWSFDWSIFEKPIVPMDKASGTQILIESLGERRNILYC